MRTVLVRSTSVDQVVVDWCKWEDRTDKAATSVLDSGDHFPEQILQTVSPEHGDLGNELIPPTECQCKTPNCSVRCYQEIGRNCFAPLENSPFDKTKNLQNAIQTDPEKRNPIRLNNIFPDWKVFISRTEVCAIKSFTCVWLRSRLFPPFMSWQLDAGLVIWKTWREGNEDTIVQCAPCKLWNIV